jgi:hypothetical protein
LVCVEVKNFFFLVDLAYPVCCGADVYGGASVSVKPKGTMVH